MTTISMHIMLKSNEANSDGLNEPSLVLSPVNVPRGRPQLRLDGGAEDGLGVQPLGQGGAPAKSGCSEATTTAPILGCNSIDICKA